MYLLKMPLRGVPVVRGLSISSDDCFLHRDMDKDKERSVGDYSMKYYSIRVSALQTRGHLCKHMPPSFYNYSCISKR